MIVGADVHAKIITNPSFREAVKYQQITSRRDMEKQIASWLGLDNYLVAGAFHNTAVEGQSATLAGILDPENAWLGYMNPEVSEKSQTAFKVFAFNGGEGGLGNRYRQGVEAKTYDLVQRNATHYEINLYVDLKVIMADAGVFITDAVA